MKRSVLLLIACLTAFPVMAAGPLDALRAESRTAREQVSTLKTQQLSQRNELAQLSSRIETLKAQSKGKLLPGGELDAALKRSQELSGALSELAAQVSGRESTLETTNVALLEALSAELTRLRTQFDRQTDRLVRASLIESMRKVRTERDALRQTLPATRVPSLESVKPTDDPEELLAQADLLRDSEEKLRRDLKVLDTRIAERREEADLDRRVQRFMGEESMFDDGDRRLRVRQTAITPASAPTTNPNDTANGVQSPAMTSPPESVNTSAGTGGPATTGSLADAFGSPTPSRNEAGATNTYTGLDSSTIRVTNASDARVQTGSPRGLTVNTDGDVKQLEAEKARLLNLAAQLKQKADELERRAR